jgi:APA family basic amino acid/polyamine antiporter
MSSEPGGELKRSLGLLDATMLVAGSMIGSGIFIVSSEISRSLGGTGYLMLTWIIAGVVTIIAALSYGELAGMMPRAGGQYIYLKESYNSLIGFLYGWSLFSVIQTGTIAAVAVAFAKFTSVFFPALGTDNIIFSTLISGFEFKVSAAQLLAISSIVLLTLINLGGIKSGKLVQTLFTSAKLLALLGLILAGLFVGMNSEVLSQNLQHMWDAYSVTKGDDGLLSRIPLSGMALLTALGVAMVGSLFSSDAWNNVTFISAEIRNPKRNIPLSLFLGTLIVTIIYLLANLVYISVLPVQGEPLAADIMGKGMQFATNDRVGTAAASMIMGDEALYVMAALIMVSTFGCNNGLILSGARVYYAMAVDGLFLKRAASLNRKEVPAFSLTIQCIWACILCLSGTYGELLNYTIFAALLFYMLTIAGIFILRKKAPDAERPYKAWGYPLLPLLYIGVAAGICLALLVNKPSDVIPCIFIVLLGVPFYYLQKRGGNSAG